MGGVDQLWEPDAVFECNSIEEQPDGVQGIRTIGALKKKHKPIGGSTLDSLGGTRTNK